MFRTSGAGPPPPGAHGTSPPGPRQAQLLGSGQRHGSQGRPGEAGLARSRLVPVWS